MLRQRQGEQWQEGAWWLRVLVLLCVSLLTAAGTAQACHVHDAGALKHGRQTVLVAPVQDCAWCAATQAALPAQMATVAAPLPRSVAVRLRADVWPGRAIWDAKTFGRPPPLAPAAGRMGRLQDDCWRLV